MVCVPVSAQWCPFSRLKMRPVIVCTSSLHILSWQTCSVRPLNLRQERSVVLSVAFNFPPHSVLPLLCIPRAATCAPTLPCHEPTDISGLLPCSTPSLNIIQVKSSHRRSPYAVKFEDRSQDGTERQERCARGDAWKLAKNIFKLKKNGKKLHSIRLAMSGFAGRIHNNAGGKRVCGGLRSKHAYGQQERP